MAAGGPTKSLALLKTKKTDAALHGWTNMVELKVRGQVRDLIRMSDYIPRQWINHVVYSRKDFKQGKRDLSPGGKKYLDGRPAGS